MNENLKKLINEYKSEIIKDEVLINITKKLTGSKKVIIICGPTCAGKSEAALFLAKLLDTDIISVDSMQVYRNMDIGTDKYDTDALKIKQFMTDIFEPDHILTVVEFREICRKIIDDEFLKKDKIPVLAGGSGLYMRAVVDNLKFTSRHTYDSKVRKEISDEINTYGADKMYEELKKIDPLYSAKISKNDVKRIIRALEVYKITGNTFSSFQTNWNERKSIYNCIFIGMTSCKDKLHKNIEIRVNKMIKRGLVKEVENLVAKGYGNCNSLTQAVGYKEVLKYLEGHITLDECINDIIKNTKKLAKKQLTWFRADPRIQWIITDNYDNIFDLTNSIVNILKKDIDYEEN